jgi:hypothetical protein
MRKDVEENLEIEKRKNSIIFHGMKDEESDSSCSPLIAQWRARARY